MKDITKIIFICLLTLYGSTATAQQCRVVCKLPTEIDESSGLELEDKNTLITFNDSGGKAVLYYCDTLSNIKRTVQILNAVNQDWEDIAQDDNGNLYIGDFGNNKNKRKDLKIYKIKATDKDTATAEIIQFHYEDQQAFPPEDKEFDCESVIWFDHHLYLFTKHRNLPMATKVYKIPDTPGQYTAELLDRFDTGEPNADENEVFDYWITAADISPDKSKVVLLSGNKIWLFSDFESDDFFNGKSEIISLGMSTQKEAICFSDNETLLITDEHWSALNIGQKVYELKLTQTSTSATSEDHLKKAAFYPNPCRDTLYFSRPLEKNGIKVYAANGSQIYPEIHDWYMDMSAYPVGIYLIEYQEQGKRKRFSFTRLRN